MTDFYYTYEDLGDNDRLFKSIHSTQAQATDAAADDTNLSAATGILDIPDYVTSGAWIYNSDEDKWRFVESNDVLTGVDLLKNAARLMHDEFLVWADQIDEIAYLHSELAVGKVHDWLAYAHPGAARVVNSTTWTIADRIKFCEEMASGPADITDAESFLEEASDIEAPSMATVWVDPDTLARVNIAIAISTTGGITGLAAVPSIRKLLGGEWINDITA